MLPYLSNFEEIKLEANRLTNYSINEIRIMDEEFIVNVYCALMSSALKKVREYSEKYFGGISIEICLQRLPKAIAHYIRSNRIDIDPINVFYYKMTEDNFHEVLMHELTHSIHFNHKIEFWRYLQHALYLEGIIKEERIFRLEKVSCFKTGDYYNLYHGEKQLTDDRFWWNTYYEPDGYKYVKFTPLYDPIIEEWEKLKAITDRIFIYNNPSAYRKVKKSVYLVDDKGHFILMKPIWEKFIKRYNLYSSFVLDFYGHFSESQRKNVLNINNYKPFIPE